jgi:predicted nucleotidyltransferase component of viral defense system
MTAGKNIAASIRQRLLNIARVQKIEFQLILTRFALERFLYRLSQSKYSNDFVLKGAMLFQVWGGSSHRPTRDLDLLSFGEPDIAYFTKTITEICDQDFSDDGLLFHSESILLERIKEEDEYQGLRTTMIATLDSARIPLQIDIGFGDAIIPAPANIDYPTLLDLPIPKLRAYAKETVIAEKFHAMVHRGIANSRMKDFYDIWVLATTYSFGAKVLKDAIESTFKRRDTQLPIEPPLALTTEFAEDTTKMAQWSAFIRKGKLLAPESITLKQVVPILEKFIVPAIMPSTESENSDWIWDPKSMDWIKKAV